MNGRGTWVRLLAVAWLTVLSARAADPSAPGDEQQAWDVAARLFDGAVYDLAERELAGFINAFPKSPRLAEAGLLLGQARFQTGKYAEGLEGLRAGVGAAGELTLRYRFWMAECLLQLKEYDPAIREYAAVLEGTTDPLRRLEAAVGQAYALQLAGQPGEAFAALAQPDGVFLTTVAGHETADNAVRGFLLLGETALASGQAAAGQTLLSRLPAEGLRPPESWQREILLGRLQAAAGDWERAAATLGAVLQSLAGETNSATAGLRAGAVALAGEVAERRGDPMGALSLLESNLVVGVPAPRRAEAAAAIARLGAADGRAPATQRLEAILARLPQDPVLTPVRVTLAELGLRRFFGTPPAARSGASGVLDGVRRDLSPVLTNAPGPWTARAQFALGWCAWEEAQGQGSTERLEESARAFEDAAAGLPVSVEQAVAHCKAGDARYALTNYPLAVAHYWQVATNYGDVPEVGRALGDQALYQIVRASVASGDVVNADQALKRILADYPQGAFGGRALLVLGQALGRQGQPAEARQLFLDFLQKFPSSPQAAELGLAIARTWQQEGRWAEAAAEYERWIQAHDADHPSRAQAEYELGWSAQRAGDDAVALQRFTAFLERFPNHPLAPAALHWVADHHFNGGQFDVSEREYQLIYQNTNWPPSNLSLHARMMAGRSAYRRTSYREARDYFTGLINLIDTNAPPAILPEAYFALGDTIRDGATADNLLESLREAVVAYSKIPQNHPDSPLVPLAWGEIGNCHFQLATADAKRYDLAMAAYSNVVASVEAAVPARSQAAVGLAMCLERKAALPNAGNRGELLVAALGRYLEVTDGANLRAGETADPFWVERAGAGGAQLAEQLQRWEVAERLYERLMNLAGPLRERYQARRDRVRLLRDQAEPAGNGG